MSNCTFSGNSAESEGGGMYNSGSIPSVVHCSFSGNTTDLNGGGMYNAVSSPIVNSCTFWSNCDVGGIDKSAQIHTESGTPMVTYSNIQGGGGGATGNIDADPLFIDDVGVANTFGTDDDDLHLLVGSPCIDAADSTPLVALNVVVDLGKKVRFYDINSIVHTGTGIIPFTDMGPYELSGCVIPGDINCDGIVDIFDFMLLVSHWLESTAP